MIYLYLMRCTNKPSTPGAQPCKCYTTRERFGALGYSYIPHIIYSLFRKFPKVWFHHTCDLRYLHFRILKYPLILKSSINHNHTCINLCENIIKCKDRFNYNVLPNDKVFTLIHHVHNFNDISRH